jgi:hypothetical protein
VLKLTVKERIMAIGVLPDQGDYQTLKLVQSARAHLDLSPVEREMVGLAQDASGIHWLDGSEPDLAEARRRYVIEMNEDGREVELTELEERLLRQSLSRADDEHQLSMDALSLYEKVVG